MVSLSQFFFVRFLFHMRRFKAMAPQSNITLLMFPLGSSYLGLVISRLCFFPFDVSDGRCGIIVSIPDHCLPFYFVLSLFVPDLSFFCFLGKAVQRDCGIF